MGQLGVHFAITDEQAQSLLDASDDDELVERVQEIEEDRANDHFDTDKAWDALHRCLSDGSLDVEAGVPPLNQVFFGGRVLNEDEGYFVVLVTPDEVKLIAEALAMVTPEWLRARYFETRFPEYQGEKSEEDCEYTVENFEGLPEFFARSARAGRHVIFTVDQ